MWYNKFNKEKRGVTMKELIHESGEDYLEAILVIKKEKGNVRSIDIANHLNYSKPSVSRAMSILKEKGFIVIEKGIIELTESGRKIAEATYEKHVVFTNFFTQIGVDEKTASQDACKLEHAISEKTFECLKKYINEHQD